MHAFENQLGDKLKMWANAGNPIKLRIEFLSMSMYDVKYSRHTGTAVGQVYSVGFKDRGRPTSPQHRISINAPSHGMAWCVIIVP